MVRSATSAPISMWNFRDSSRWLVGISDRHIEVCCADTRIGTIGTPYDRQRAACPMVGKTKRTIHSASGAPHAPMESYAARGEIRPRRTMKPLRPRDVPPGACFKYSVYLPMAWNVVTQPRGLEVL